MLTGDYQRGPMRLKHPAMSGDVRRLIDDGMAMTLIIPERVQESLDNEVPAEEWNVDVTEKPWGTRKATVVAPRDGQQEPAYIASYQPMHQRDRGRLSRNDWEHAAPSPNPGMLAYYITDRLTAISVPMMCKDGVRHDFYRHLFLEVNNAPGWLEPARYHNNPGCTLAEERELVDELRGALT